MMTEPATPRRLLVTMQSYWHCGSGGGTRFDLDRVVRVDRLGLPFIPGRALRGSLRDGSHRAEDFGFLPSGTTKALFGRRLPVDDTGSTTEPVANQQGGFLQISDATLGDDVALAVEGGEIDAAVLIHHLSQTAMNEDGVALDRSLRKSQVAVPMVLQSSLDVLANANEDWTEQLTIAFAFVDGIGAMRSRGLGKCLLEWHLA